MGGVERTGVGTAESQSTAERQMIEIELIVLVAMPAEVGDMIEPVVDSAIDEAVEPVSTGQRVAAALAFDKVVSAIACDRVGKVGAADARDAAEECVGSDRGIAGGGARSIESERDRDAGRGIVVADAGIAVAGDGVVAAHALEFIEVAATACIGAGRRGSVAGEPYGIVGVGEVGAAYGLDRDERVGPDRRIARDDAGRERDVDARCYVAITAVDCAVEAPIAIDQVIAAAAVEILRRARGVGASEERVGKVRATDRTHAGKSVGADPRDIAGVCS